MASGISGSPKALRALSKTIDAWAGYRDPPTLSEIRLGTETDLVLEDETPAERAGDDDLLVIVGGAILFFELHALAYLRVVEDHPRYRPAHLVPRWAMELFWLFVRMRDKDRKRLAWPHIFRLAELDVEWRRALSAVAALDRSAKGKPRRNLPAVRAFLSRHRFT